MQPSLHARGARPYVFTGAVDEWHAPGADVSTRSGTTRAAVDAAWLCERVLGAAHTSAARWPGVFGAREHVERIAAQVGASPYQVAGATFLAERDYACLFDQMGLGKTMQALVAVEARLAMSVVPTTETPAVLIVCPALAKYSWKREIQRWLGYEAAIIDGLRVTEVPRARYIITNYDILYGKTKRDASGVVRDLEHLTGWGSTFGQQGFAAAILDEAHMLRGRQSRRTQAVKKMCKRIPIVWALTGTPMPNYVRDIWALIDVVSDGLFGYSYWSWAKKYCSAALGQYGWKDTGSAYPEELSARLGYFCLGRSSASVALELPEKRREVLKLDVTMTATTRHEGAVAMASKASFVASALRATARAKRPAAIEQIVEAVQAGQKVVAYTYMREQADEIAKAVKAKVDAPVFAVHGDMTPQGRDQQAGVFRDTTGAAAFVATIDSVGVAISLVGADLVLYCDLVPEPWKLLQSEKRAHRRGSTKRVIVRYLIGVGTLDEGVVESVIDKLAAIEASLGNEADQGELVQQLGGNVRSDESIIESLFTRLVGG